MTKKKMLQTIEEAKAFLRLILHTEEAKEFLKKRAEGATTEKDP